MAVETRLHRCRPSLLRAARRGVPARMGLGAWLGVAGRMASKVQDTSTQAGAAVFLPEPRPTLASRLLTRVGVVAGKTGGVPTFVAEIILVFISLSLFQILVRVVRQAVLVLRRIAALEAPHMGADGGHGSGPGAVQGTGTDVDGDEILRGKGPTGNVRSPLAPPAQGVPFVPLSLLAVSVLGASVLDSLSVTALGKVQAPWAGWAHRARLGCDMLLEVSLAAVALHLLDVLRSRIVSEEQAKLGQTIMSGGPGGRPRVLDRGASISEARLNTLVQTLSAAVWVCTAFALLDTAGVNYRALVTLGGVSSVLLGFIGRDVLSNLMGATVLYATQPFTKGDWIQSIRETSDGRREVDGWVEKIGWYYTVINTWEKRPLHLPNSKLATMEVINASRMTNRRILWQPRVRLSDMASMPRIVADMREALLNNPELDPKQHRFVFLRGVSELSLDLWISCHTKSVFLEDYLRINQGIIFTFAAILRKHGARFADRNQREARILRAEPMQPPPVQPRMVPVGGLSDPPPAPATYSPTQPRAPTPGFGGAGAPAGPAHAVGSTEVSSEGAGSLGAPLPALGNLRLPIEVDSWEAEEEAAAVDMAAQESDTASATGSAAAAAADAQAKATLAEASQRLEELERRQAELEEQLQARVAGVAAREEALNKQQEAAEAMCERLLDSVRQREAAYKQAMAALEKQELSLQARERGLRETNPGAMADSARLAIAEKEAAIAASAAGLRAMEAAVESMAAAVDQKDRVVSQRESSLMRSKVELEQDKVRATEERLEAEERKRQTEVLKAQVEQMITSVAQPTQSPAAPPAGTAPQAPTRGGESAAGDGEAGTGQETQAAQAATADEGAAGIPEGVGEEVDAVAAAALMGEAGDVGVVPGDVARGDVREQPASAVHATTAPSQAPGSPVSPGDEEAPFDEEVWEADVSAAQGQPASPQGVGDGADDEATTAELADRMEVAPPLQTARPHPSAQGGDIVAGNQTQVAAVAAGDGAEEAAEEEAEWLAGDEGGVVGKAQAPRGPGDRAGKGGEAVEADTPDIPLTQMGE